MTVTARARILVGAASALLAACVQTQDFPATDGADGPAAGSLPPAACGSIDDPENCGACGHSCLGGACARGQCQPVVLVENEPTDNDTIAWQALAADATHVYWQAVTRIARVPVAGGAVDRLGTYPATRTEKLRLVGDWIYTHDWDAVVRIPKDGGALERVTPALPGVSTVQTFDVVEGHVAWSANRDDANGVSVARLFHCSLPCTEPEERFAEDISAGSIGRSATNLYAGYHYYTGESQGTGVASVTAAYKSALVTNPFGEIVVEETPEEAFAYGAGMGAVARARLPLSRPDGNQPYVPDKVLASDPELWPRSLTLVGDDLYWIHATREEPGVIYRADKRGRALPEAILSDWRPVTLTATEHAIYFTTADGKIAKLARPLPVVVTTPDSQN